MPDCLGGGRRGDWANPHHRTNLPGAIRVGISERAKEIKRRRHRRKKMSHLIKRAEKASVSEKTIIAGKIRGLTPGAEALIERLSLEER